MKTSEKVTDGLGSHASVPVAVPVAAGVVSRPNSHSRSTLGGALVSAKKYALALAEYKKALVIRKKKSSKTVGRTHLDIARALHASGDKKNAIVSAKQARKVFEAAKSKGGVKAADKLLKKLSGK